MKKKIDKFNGHKLWKYIRISVQITFETFSHYEQKHQHMHNVQS